MPDVFAFANAYSSVAEIQLTTSPVGTFEHGDITQKIMAHALWGFRDARLCYM